MQGSKGVIDIKKFYFLISNFIPCFCFIGLLNRNGENRLPCFVTNLKGKTFNTSSVTQIAGFLEMSFIRLRNIPSITYWLKVSLWLFLNHDGC